MIKYFICLTLCALVWFWNIKKVVMAIKENVISEIFMHFGLSLFLTLLVTALMINNSISGNFINLLWLKITGFILFIPSLYLVLTTSRTLRKKGKIKQTHLDSTVFIDTGIFSIIRQPMTLGMAIWSISFMMIFQSILSIILGIFSLFCFWMSARTEGSYNIKKYGNAYKEYMNKVPMWNIFKRRRNSVQSEY